MPLKFGTSGVRGLVSEFTDREVYLLVTSFLKYACPNSESTPVATGMDLRESSPNLLKAAHRAITDFGCPIYSCGVLPTPALANFAQIKNFLSLMITGSHIPADRNGIKFYLTTGETLKQDDENIFSIYQNLRDSNFSDHLFNADGKFKDETQSSILEASDLANSLYIQRYTEFFPKRSLEGMKVLIYQHSSAARDLLPKILRALGATPIPIGRSDNFIPVDTEAVESLDQFRLWIKSHSADALVSTDGDGDRPLLIDNHGNLVHGDKLGMITAQFLNIEAIALPISCNSGASQIQSFKEITFTKIGSPFVVEALNTLGKRYARTAGFEANGGFILSSSINGPPPLDALPTRDSTLPIIATLAAAKNINKGISDLVESLPPRFTSSILVKNCPPEQSARIIALASASPDSILKDLLGQDSQVESVSTLDGIRITSTNQEVVHLRPSGNAPEFRCYIEAKSQVCAEKIAALSSEKIRNIIGTLT